MGFGDKMFLAKIHQINFYFFQKNFELYEGISPGLVFQLSPPPLEAMVFTAENDNLAEKWINALREATVLDVWNYLVILSFIYISKSKNFEYNLI